MANETWSFMTVRELSERIRAREVSPVDLAEFYLERLERLGPRFNAVVTLTRERALEEARAAEAEINGGNYRGPLHGVPYGVKDLLATSDYRTTWGAAPYKDQSFDFDGTVITRLKEAGAVLVAKLAMVELAGGMGYNHADASFTGPGLNPWNTDYWSGGSSSGPGSAVSAGLVPFAIGSETSGSILTPACFCGLTGLRPTYGRVSRRGAMALCWSLDKLGPMARTAEDCGLVMEAISAKDPLDPTSVDRPWDANLAAALTTRPRLAVPKGVLEKPQPEVGENFRAAMEVMRTFADITEEVEWPEFPWGPAVGNIVGAEGAAAFADLIDRGGLSELRCPRDRYAGYSGMFVFAVDYLQAMRLRVPMRKAVEEFYSQFDAVLAPTRPTVAYPADRVFDKVYPDVKWGPPLIPAGNLCGLPAVCLPMGMGEKGLPTSLQLMGPAFSEERLTAIAHAYQQATAWHGETPSGL
jgi:aspartyl-tRNA(Asn)/glutamyl-tRNA(Gln) amidotransferase subunit A